MNPTSPERQGKGTVFVRPEICKGCSFCIDFCPTDCLEFTKDFNAKGYHFPILARPADCSGCDLCGLYCPDFAIYGERWKDIDARQAKGPPTAPAIVPKPAAGPRVQDPEPADPKGVLTGIHFMDGDHAACEGALAAGCRFVAGYPITPSTEVVERFASRIPTVGGIFIQM